jgi:translation initiation factor 5B
MTIRQPIITVLGHVDHGKTSVLDFIRGSTLADREAGKITQHIGATEIPLDTIKEICGDLLDIFKLKFDIPGLLFVDTPGHEAFSNLRKRGGSIADLAVLVIDINQGIQPQTKEAIEILKNFKVPFIIAANKVDLIYGWKSESNLFVKNFETQTENSKKYFNDKFYTILGELAELGFDSNLYHKVENHKKMVSIVPVSAKTGEGIAELLAILAGLSQKFLGGKLEIDSDARAKGTILEIKEEQGMGTTADIIIYDGNIKQDDIIVVGGINETITTKVKALLKPKALSEIRDTKSSFEKLKQVFAATGVKILANDLDRALAGAPILSAETEEEIEEAEKEILKEIKDVLIQTENDGIMLKADTLGSIEAASKLFEQHEIPIKQARIGNISKRDIVEAESSAEKGSLYAVVLGFNVKIDDDVASYAKKKKIDVILNNVIYKVVEDFKEKLEERKKRLELEELDDLSWPGKIKIMPQYIFRKANPAIFGAEILSGKISTGINLINLNGKKIGRIKSIEDKGEKLKELTKGQESAVSVSGMTIGRNAEGGEEFYTDISEHDFRKLKSKKEFLSSDEKEILKEIAGIKRNKKDTWGI